MLVSWKWGPGGLLRIEQQTDTITLPDGLKDQLREKYKVSIMTSITPEFRIAEGLGKLWVRGKQANSDWTNLTVPSKWRAAIDAALRTVNSYYADCEIVASKGFVTCGIPISSDTEHAAAVDHGRLQAVIDTLKEKGLHDAT